jgi:glycosyltransferase involved in cell wall biosynthesis/SAM-dependent methyltransferase
MANEISTGDKNDFSLPWTGERFVPSLQGPIYYEHLHRYALALELVADRNCLDIACGEGFGSSLLAGKAKFVWGVDLDEACIDHACKKYVKNNLKFLAGSATRIPMEDNSVDVVVSFETIEHFGEHDAFMQEISRVLTPDGFLIISSPDKNEYSDKTGHHNPYHITELDHSEFNQLLKRYFSQVKLGRQRLAVGSYILPDETYNKDMPICGVFRGSAVGTNYEEGLPDGVYSIAICSNKALPKIKYGLFEDLMFLRGVEAIQAKVNAEDKANRQDQQMTEQKAAIEKAQNQIDGLILEKDHAHLEHEQAKASSDQQLTEQKEATERAQNQVDNLIMEKDHARLEHEQAKASWDQQLTEQKAAIERAQNQIDTLIIENHELEEVVDSAAKWQQRPWFKRAFYRWRAPKIQKRKTEKNLIAASGLFDADFYARMYPDVVAAGMNLLDHYVIFGRREGRVPSEKFDPWAYLEANPDLDRHAVDPILHYILHGQQEGRSLVSQAEREAEDILRKYKTGKLIQVLLQLPYMLRFLLPKAEREAEDILRKYKARKPMVLVVSHEGSRTGAPILAYNLTLHLLKQFDVIVLFLGPGPILEACSRIGAIVLGPIRIWDNSAKADRFATMLLKYIQPRFAIVNSVESRQMGTALSRVGVPTVSLIHEFAAYTRPRGVLYDVAWHSDATIFSTTLTRDNALEYHPDLSQMDLPVIPQGPCALPQATDRECRDHAEFSDKFNQQVLRPSNFPVDGVVVLGMGSVQLRKGVDLFLDCAVRIKRMESKIPIRFVWVGKGFNPEVDLNYSVYLADQIRRAGLEDMVQIIDEMASIEQVYAASNILLLTSRLDPLPNVAIDVLIKGIPIICFDQTTGMANYLKAHGLGDSCVARYLDTGDMAEKLLALVQSKKLRADLGEKSSKLAADLFSMPRYVEKIVEIGERQILRRQEIEQEAEFIASANILRADFVLQPNSINLSPFDLARYYLTSWKKNIHLRKPFPGFHPGIYREVRGLAKGGIDPLADYLRSGQPEGPWRLPVIIPGMPGPPKVTQRIALHLHAYYPDVVPMILDRLQKNDSSFDLIVSVTSDQHRNQVLGLLKSYTKGEIDVRIVPNVGRDLGAFLSCFSETIRENYDLVGHIHTKKSIHLDPHMGEEWIKFLLENLLGGQAPMADIILNAFAQDERIGMVFPDDPHVLSWGRNRSYGNDLGKRLKLPALREEINFPVGTMFWSRVSALEALFNLKLSWEDYPKEPLPIDGSMLHALERLLPSIVIASGRSLAVTNVPGITR